MRKILPILLFVSALGTVLLMTRRFEVSQPHRHRPLDVEDAGAQQLWDYLRLRNPATGEIPRGIHSRELAYAQYIRAGMPAYKGVPTIHTSTWNFAGPVDAGGRTHAIGIDTMDEAVVLMATAHGGIFRSTDSGATWARTTTPGQLKNTFTLVQDHRPGKTNVWYAGTGELISTTWRRTSVSTAQIPHFADVGNGMYKSTDDGRSWHALPSTVNDTSVLLGGMFNGVWNIVVDNARQDSDIVYAACYGAILRSNDGGVTWERVLGDPTHVPFATDVAIASSGILYAFLSGQTADQSTSPTSGVWRSADGFHWTNISPSIWPEQTGRMRIAIAPSDENIVYVGGFDPDELGQLGFYEYTYQSGNGSGVGGAWDDRSQNVPVPSTPTGGDGINTYGGYAITLSVFPSDANTVFFGGTNLFRSSDAFASDSEWIGGYPENYYSYYQYGYLVIDHPDHHDLVFLPSNPQIALNANDGGIYKTYDILGYDNPDFPVTWTNENNDDPASMIYNVALDHASPGDTTILGGFQDQGSWMTLDSGYWINYPLGDGCYCAIADNKTDYYSSWQNGNVDRLEIDPGTQSLMGYEGVTPTAAVTAQFVSPWMLDPTNTDQMYYAADNTLWRNNDLAGIPNNQDFSTTINWLELQGCALPLGRFITALGMSQFPAHRLYYGSSDGHLYRVDNADRPNPTSKEITGSIFPKNAFVSCVAVDPQNADSVVVCFSNYEVISIFASNDGGLTWHDASGNLEQNPDGSGDGPSVRWVTIVHQNGETLYLCGTSVGLFSTTDISSPTVTWIPEATNSIGYQIVENIDARQSDGFVAIATQGSGVYTTHVVASPSAVSPITQPQFTFTITPNPANAVAKVYLRMAGTGVTKISVFDLTGAEVLQPIALSAGQGQYSLDCSRLPSGTYFVQLQSGDAVETHRLVIQR